MYFRQLKNEFPEVPDRIREMIEQQVANELNIERPECIQEGKKSPKALPKRAKWTAAAAFAAVIIFATGVSAAINHGDFFDAFLGNSTKQNIEQHDEIQEKPDGRSSTVTFPEREYVKVDEEKAEALLGEYIADENLVIPVGDHTLTIESMVYDKNGAMVYFTLERDGGVTMLKAAQWTNEDKGAYMNEDADIMFRFNTKNDRINVADYIHVDFSKSTNDKWYCYAYILVGGHYDGKYELQVDVLDLKSDEIYVTVLETYPLVQEAPVDVASYYYENSALELSPFCMNICFDENIGLDDGYNIKTVKIVYKDGNEYVVEDKENNIENISAVCNFTKDGYKIMFNRLVDTDNIDYILVNDYQYKAE